ncbi:MAG: hypothetical protein COX72_02080 [Gammaproteobacteria bacterium CG_4_10_14_0_2_um_filter_38_22]|nr:MAG: hypothetical protein COX72_02080 [Gammaproteobacteria bacterium CG_4_10_14_0_2_um_filter_38_22]PJB11019.1 MAG: hypothetical protein CO120_01855 [Gammaproteobacteria bacterium CG_4_9_14_3_um_filter_38_9]
MTKKIIDLTLGAKRIESDQAAALAMLKILLKAIHFDEQAIQLALDQKNWIGLSEANHKLLGGLLYCGAPQLEQATIALQTALSKQDEKKYGSLSRCVLSEIKTLDATFSALIKTDMPQSHSLASPDAPHSKT